eukprot:2213929-Prymnesium_polylepis.1
MRWENAWSCTGVCWHMLRQIRQFDQPSLIAAGSTRGQRCCWQRVPRVGEPKVTDARVSDEHRTVRREA